ANRLRRIVGSTSDAVSIGESRQVRCRWIAGAAICFSLSIAVTLDRLDASRTWWGFHSIEVSWLLIAMCLLAAFVTRISTRIHRGSLEAREYSAWSAALFIGVAVMALFGSNSD